MFIVIWAGGMPFDGNTIPKGESLGGSETAAYYMAKELAALGHKVTCFVNKDVSHIVDGVQYVGLGAVSDQHPLGEKFHYFSKTPMDACIVQRVPHAFLHPINAKIKLWWLHDLALTRQLPMVNVNLINTDLILAVSNWHKKQVEKVYDLSPDVVKATTNGVDYSMFHPLPLEAREPRSLLYTARPERGLVNLVGEGGIMEILTDCHLYVCGYDNTQPNMAAFYKALWDRCEKLPNVTNLGPLGKKALADREALSMVHVYPTEFEDTSCIAALEAQAAGTPFICSDISATPETLEGGGYILVKHDKDGKVDRHKFANKVTELLANPSRWQQLHKMALAKKQEWSTAAKQWEGLITEQLSLRGSDQFRLHKHLEHMSDIEAIDRQEAGHLVPLNPHPGAQRLVDDLKVNYAFKYSGDVKDHYKRWFEYEKARGTVYGPHTLAGQPRFEHTKGILAGIAAKHDQSGAEAPLRVLDYGTAHGHYVMNLARYVKAEYHGIDIEPTMIEIAEKWRDDAYEKTPGQKDLVPITFQAGEHEDVVGEFDVIMANEVIEHLIDPKAVLESLMEHLAPGGTMMVSTPYGPWESEGYHINPGWRAHIHHFERADLEDMFGGQDNFYLACVPLDHMKGNYIVTFTPSDREIGDIDYERKLSEQAPMETLSLCMIVKDEEHTLGNCLKKVAGIVDEIIIGIDEGTTDETERVALKYGAKVFKIKSPVEVGFDAARNFTIDKATMDWILWLDADETLENAERLLKYLRPNTYEAYAVQQHHYAIEPAALFQTDRPARLFRNHRGVKFYGVVHEHPGKDENHAFDRTIELPDVAIMHCGYPTDAVRKARFMRNFPLMQRDRQKYPDRELGWMLWIRDVSLLIQYRHTGEINVPVDELKQAAGQGIAMWNSLIKKNMRMCKDSLPWYSILVQYLGSGIPYAVRLASTVKGGPELLDDRPMYTGHFYCLEDIRNFTAALVDEQIGGIDGKYF